MAALSEIIVKASRAGSRVLENALRMVLLEAGVEPSKAEELASKIASLPPAKILDYASKLLKR